MLPGILSRGGRGPKPAENRKKHRYSQTRKLRMLSESNGPVSSVMKKR